MIRTEVPVIRNLDDLPELATRSQLAQFTGISVQTFARGAVEGSTGPRMGYKALRTYSDDSPVVEIINHAHYYPRLDKTVPVPRSTLTLAGPPTDGDDDAA